MKVGDGRQGKRRSGMLFSKDALSLCNSLAAFCLFSAHLRTAHRLACVSGGFLLCFFFCGSESKSQSRAKAKPRQKQKTTWGRGRAGEGSEKNRLQFFLLPSLPVPSPIVFFFVLGSSFVGLNLLLYVPPNKKNTPKSPPTARATHRVGKCAQFACRSNRSFSDPAAVLATIRNRESSDRYMIKKCGTQYFVLLVTLSRSP